MRTLSEHRTPEVGEIVVFHDELNQPHNALVTAVHSATCVNLVHTSGDPARRDDYGRQTERKSSCSHKSSNPVAGMYWRYPQEQPNERKAPIAV